jgi:RNase P/RNase MRP subunit POP5
VLVKITSVTFIVDLAQILNWKSKMVRLKHRYIISQLILEQSSLNNDISVQDILNCIRDRINELCGDLGMGRFGKILLFQDFPISFTRRKRIRTRYQISTGMYKRNKKQILCDTKSGNMWFSQNM